ncbi:MAG: TetR/AcrR family transcriptional regulator [Sandaracinaceae bacterium]
MQRAARGAKTKQALIDAAIKLFSERGYGATSLKAIAEAAEISHGVIPFHFGSKEGLLLAVVESLFERFTDAVIAPLAEHERDYGSRDLEALMHAMLRFQTEHPEVGRLFQVLMFEAIGPTPELRPHFESFHERLFALGRGWVREGVARGALRQDLDVDAAVQGVLSFFTGLRTYRLLLDDRVDPHRVHEQMLSFIRRGALPDPVEPKEPR